MNQPVIVLVRPQLGENIGMVARAMWNFGLCHLRLVEPRDGWPNPAAGPAASGADVVLDKAELFDTLEAAVADCNRVYATAMTLRRMIKETTTPGGAVEQMNQLAAQGGRSAIVFGPERTGLTTEEVAMGDVLISIPTNPEFGSLNLAQAVIVLAYEWHRQQDTTPPVRLEGDYEGPATRETLDGLINHLNDLLEPRGYFHPDHRTESMKRTLRNIFERPGFTGQEVRTLRGVMRCLAGELNRKPASDIQGSGEISGE